jgi:uncharacterized protein (TIGR01244 family)
MRRLLILAALLAPALAAAAFDGSALPDTVPDWDGFRGRIHREGRVYIGGQPGHDTLLELPARGVTCVVNLRTPDEMDNRERVPFDEAALVDSLGVEYVNIPLGGDEHPYTPAAVAAFADVLSRHEGPVLLHCTVAWRASHLWAAYLVRHEGFAVPDAYRRGELMGIGATPFAKFLDEELLFVPKE